MSINAEEFGGSISLDSREYRIKLRSGNPSTAQHRAMDPPDIIYVDQGVLIEQDEIRDLANLDGSQIVLHAEKYGGIDRPGSQRLVSRQSGCNEIFEPKHTKAWIRGPASASPSPNASCNSMTAPLPSTARTVPAPASASSLRRLFPDAPARNHQNVIWHAQACPRP